MLVVTHLTFNFFFLFLELTRVSEEAPPVTSPVALPVSEPQAPAQSLSHSQPSRTEESERPAEQQPPLELPPEPCKVNLHVPMSNSMLESLPMNHISTTLAGGIWVFNFKVNRTFCQLVPTTRKTSYNLLFCLTPLYRSICSFAHCPATAAKAH